MANAKSWTNAAFKTRALVQQGTLTEVPVWVEVMERFGAFEPKKGKSPKQIHFSEDSLYQAYMAKFPEFLQQPLDLNSERPPAMKLFVMAQSALMEQGYNRKAAFRMVEEEFKQSGTSMALSVGQQTLAAAQRLEERTLQKALKERRDEVGPPAGLVTPSQQAPATPAFSFRLPPRPQAAAQPQDSLQGSHEGANAMSGQAQTQPGTSMPGVSSQQHGAGHQQANSRGQQPQMQTSQGGASPGRRPGHTAPPGFVPFGSSKS